jgi:hypothetical protein
MSPTARGRTAWKRGVIFNSVHTLGRKKIGDLLLADQLVPYVPQPAEFSLIHTDKDAILIQGVKVTGSIVKKVLCLLEHRLGLGMSSLANWNNQ